jgi:hypothetical protein
MGVLWDVVLSIHITQELRECSTVGLTLVLQMRLQGAKLLPVEVIGVGGGLFNPCLSVCYSLWCCDDTFHFASAAY